MAIVDIPARVCPHCGGTRWSVEPKKTGFVRYRCPVLAQERRKRWKAKNPERVLQHLKTNAEKRVAAGYFKQRRQLIKEQSIINSQLNSNKMATNPYFYSWKDIKDMKELIRTGEPIIRIARREYQRFGASSASAFALKLYKIAQNTTKIRQWEGSRRERTPKAEMPQTQPNQGLAIPAGTTFEGRPKRVEIHTDHFRIYF
jgi:hypothetical protein